jgi:hypothetical protein
MSESRQVRRRKLRELNQVLIQRSLPRPLRREVSRLMAVQDFANALTAEIVAEQVMQEWEAMRETGNDA